MRIEIDHIEITEIENLACEVKSFLDEYLSADLIDGYLITEESLKIRIESNNGV